MHNEVLKLWLYKNKVRLVIIYIYVYLETENIEWCNKIRQIYRLPAIWRDIFMMSSHKKLKN